ncbi:MAG: nucleotide sugar dehydrogenase [Dehalococcoidia bacterium]
MTTPEQLLEKVRARDFQVGIIGLGRVGLPLGIAFARSGIRVIGVDRDERLLASVRSGQMPFYEDGGEAALPEVIASGKLHATERDEDLRDADVIFITVATGLNSEQRVDYGQLHSALDRICPQLRPVQVIVLRSTVSPGTLQKIVKPYIESHTELEVGRDVLLASAPERISAGRAIAELETLPEIIGGYDQMATDVTSEVMRTLNPDKVMHQTDPVSAELAKLFTNVYRYVSFAVANEFALLAEHHGRDAHEIIGMINAGYPRGGIPLPGPCGGPCLAKDGYLLVEELSFPDFILTAWKLNEGVPSYMIGRLKDAFAANGKKLEGSKVGVLGMAFKADIDDVRHSPAMRMIEILKREGADVVVHDPYHDTPGLDATVENADAVVLATNHTAFLGLKTAMLREQTKPDCIFVDCWGIWDGADPGANVLTFGKGSDA